MRANWRRERIKSAHKLTRRHPTLELFLSQCAHDSFVFLLPQQTDNLERQHLLLLSRHSLHSTSSPQKSTQVKFSVFQRIFRKNLIPSYRRSVRRHLPVNCAPLVCLWLARLLGLFVCHLLYLQPSSWRQSSLQLIQADYGLDCFSSSLYQAWCLPPVIGCKSNLLICTYTTTILRVFVSLNILFTVF